MEKVIGTQLSERGKDDLNKENMLKNHGKIWIICDQMISTIQQELTNVKALYGITRPVKTWNTIKINFIHVKYLE